MSLEELCDWQEREIAKLEKERDQLQKQLDWLVADCVERHCPMGIELFDDCPFEDAIKEKQCLPCWERYLATEPWNQPADEGSDDE